MNDYIELAREFIPWDASAETPEDDLAYSYGRILSNERILWADLLKTPSPVVLLGEARSGKTTELRERSRLLRLAGERAFFLDMPLLLRDGVEDALVEGEHLNDLEAWRGEGGHTPARFFIDTLDEAKLQDPRQTLARALRKLHAYLGGKKDAAWVLISCRVSDFRPDEDREALLQAAGKEQASNTHERGGPLAPPTMKVNGDFHGKVSLFRFSPLSEEMIVKLARAQGLDEPKPFLQAIAQAEAWTFVTRPMDAIELCRYWQENRQLGSLTEIMHGSIQRKLAEKNDQRKEDRLPHATALRGAQRLAAATLMSKKRFIAIPRGAATHGESLSTSMILGDMPDGDVAFLLGRALFDPATYGRVRFQHRTYQEYLAACWFKELLDRGCPPARLAALFVRDIDGQQVPVPELTECAAWLCGMHTEIRRLLLRHAPEVPLFHGDPQAIPVEERTGALETVIEEYDVRRIDSWIDPATWRRIAHPDMAPTINTLLNTLPRQARRPRSLLLNVVEHGSLAACADAALAIAMDEEEDDGLRCDAVRAVGRAGDGGHKARLAEYARQADSGSHQYYGVLIRAIFPDPLTVDDCLSFIGRVEPPAPDTYSLLEDVLGNHLPEACPPKDMSRWLGGLLERMETPGPETNGERYHQQHGWLLRSMEASFNRLFDISAEDHLSLLVRTALFLRRCVCHGISGLRKRFEEMNARAGKNPAFRRALFWENVRYMNEAGRATDLWELCQLQTEICPIQVIDIGWLMRDARDGITPENRSLAFECALELLAFFRPEIPTTDSFMELARQNPEWEAKATHRLFSPPPTFDRVEKAKTKRDAEIAIQEKQITEDLLQRAPDIAQGTDHGALVFLWKKMGKSAGLQKSTRPNWQNIKLLYGDTVAQAAREGFKQAWRNCPPLLPAARTDNGIPWAAIIGLSGIQIDLDDGLNLKDLSPDRASQAARYAMWEINGLPDWFLSLWQAHPQETLEVMKQEITAEFAASQDRNGLLSSLHHEDKALLEQVGPLLWTLLKQQEPEGVGTLKDSLRLLLDWPGRPAQEVAALAREKAMAWCPTAEEAERFNIWFRVWWVTDAQSAWLWVEMELGKMELSRQKERFISLVSSWMNSPFDASLPSSIDDADLLKNMILLTCRLVDVKEDIDPYETGVFKQGKREYAQFFRSALFLRLAALPGTHRILLELAENPDLKGLRARILGMRQDNLTKAAALQPWTGDDLVEFEKRYEIDPRNGDELFRMALERVEEIKRQIEGGDYSCRDLINGDASEDRIQIFMAQQLQSLSNGRYSLAREEEVDNDKKPDIRLHHPKAGTVAVEVKPAGNSLSFLEDTLTTQLVGQYMKDDRTRHGILLLVLQKTHQWQEAADLADLTRQLNERAAEIKNNSRGKIYGLHVCAIDAKPLKPRFGSLNCSPT